MPVSPSPFPRPLVGVAAVGALAVAGSASVGRHTVVSGETLGGIARRNGVSVAELADANGIEDPDLIVTGTKLVIPDPAAPVPAPPPPPPAPAPPAPPRTHPVRPGDTLLGIAARYSVDPAAVASLNGITGRRDVRVGRELLLPEGATAGRSHLVAPGETLSGLASRYGVSSAAIARANGLGDPRSLRAGSTIAIPPAGGGAPLPAPAPAPPPAPAPAPLPPAPAGPPPPAPAPAPVPPPAPPAPVVAAAAPPPPPPPPAPVAPAIDPARLPARLRLAPERLMLIPIFQRWSAEYGLDTGLLMSLTWLESGWQNGVVSPVGAIGIGQLLPDTVDFLATEVMHQRLDPADPESNIRMSARYLKWLLDQTRGDVPQALAAYYQGLRAVNERGVLPESSVYVSTVLTIADRYF
jgi:N-acetylmuramoyl-L-alanine amidase